MSIRESVELGAITAFSVVKMENGKYTIALLSPEHVHAAVDQLQCLYVKSIHDLWGSRLGLEYCHITNSVIMESKSDSDTIVNPDGFYLNGCHIVHEELGSSLREAKASIETVLTTPPRNVRRNKYDTEPNEPVRYELDLDNPIEFPKEMTVPEMMKTTPYKELAKQLYWLGKIAKGNSRIDVLERNKEAKMRMELVKSAPSALKSALEERFYSGVRGNLPVPERLEKEFQQFKGGLTF